MADPATPEARVFNVDGMSCDHCIRAVERAVGAVAGVRDVEVRLETGEVTVTGGSDDAIRAAIEDEGYDVT